MPRSQSALVLRPTQARNVLEPGEIDLDWLARQVQSARHSHDSNASLDSALRNGNKRNASESESVDLPAAKRPHLDESAPVFTRFWTHVVNVTIEAEAQHFAGDDSDGLPPTAGPSTRPNNLTSGLLNALGSLPEEEIALESLYLSDRKPCLISVSSSSKAPATSQEQHGLVDLTHLDEIRTVLPDIRTLVQSGRLVAEPVVVRISRLTSSNDVSSSLIPILMTLEFPFSLDLRSLITSPPAGGKDKLKASLYTAQQKFLSHVLSSPQSHNPRETINVPYFFSCLQPAPALPSHVDEAFLQPPGLEVTLLPFQRRSVHFLLEREGQMFDARGNLVEAPSSNTQQTNPLWEEVDLEGSDSNSRNGGPVKAWYQPLSGKLSLEPPTSTRRTGSILAETMGLGKTIEIIALILLHTPISRNELPSFKDDELQVQIKPVKASLIVTPISLQEQWKDEFASRAPGLKVLVYEGKSKLRFPAPATSNGTNARKGKAKAKEKSFDELGEEGIEKWQTLAMEYDVILTTYTVLQGDLNAARPTRERPRRDGVEYGVQRRTRSPLILIDFTRVVMDEVQQVGGGNAAEMVSLTSRASSIAVSGTPAKASVKDLIHVLRFLQVPELKTNKAWETLLGLPDVFRRLFRTIAVRTPKNLVQHELGLKAQKRFVVPIQLGPVEQHNYDERLAESLTSLGLDARGVVLAPSGSDWELDVILLRSAIRKLRQACTHPHVGLSGTGGGGGEKGKDKVVRTIDQVLADMLDGTGRGLLESRRTLASERITRSTLRSRFEEGAYTKEDHVRELLAIKADLESLVVDIKKARAEFIHSQNATADHAPEDQPGDEDDGEDEEADSGSESDSAGASTSKNAKSNSKAGAFRTRVRETRILLHKVHFLLGDAYHQLSNTPLEDASYSAAEALRKQLLRPSEQRASRAMRVLEEKTRSGTGASAFEVGVFDVEDLDEDEIEELSEVEKKLRTELNEANDIIRLMQKQSQLLLSWRTEVINLLTQQFTNEEGSAADGDEYARALEVQGNAEAYLVAMAALLADRRETMLAERTALASHEFKDAKTRTTQRARDAIGSGSQGGQQSADAAISDIELQTQLKLQRVALKAGHTNKPLKGAMFDLRKIARDHRESRNSVVQNVVATAHADGERIKQALDAQTDVLEKFDGDMGMLRRAFNDRVTYFAYLQELSDTVAEQTLDSDASIPEILGASATKIQQLQTSIRQANSKHRYLRYLSDQYTNEADEENNACVLCKCEFTKGFVTQCAHVFCQSCLGAWMKRKPEGKACPVCRETLEASSMHKIAFADPSPTAEAITVSELLPAHKSLLQYNTLDPEIITDIQSRGSLGRFGSKIQMLISHLLYIKDRKPGSKSIVFSAWSDSLTIVAHALTLNGIKWLRNDGARRKDNNPVRTFQTDESYQVLLLHGEHDNAGLNVTAARHVFLLEPVVNHSFEVQALARVDRIGGQESEVYCYYAEDTVEKNILDLAHRRGNSLYASHPADLNTNIVGERTEPKPRGEGRVSKGDFVASADDMLEIMFPHMFLPIEDLDETMEDPESRVPEGEDASVES